MIFHNTVTADGCPLGQIISNGQLSRFEQAPPVLIIQDPASNLEPMDATPDVPFDTGRARGILQANAMVIELSKTLRNQEPGITIGRSPECDIVLTDPSVSRRHAVVRDHLPNLGTPGLWSVTDLGSKNGTRIQSRILPPNKEMFVPFGAEVLFGNIRALFIDSEGAFKLFNETFARWIKKDPPMSRSETRKLRPLA